MEFGIQFFPSVGPNDVAADQYFRESLDLVGLCDEIGLTHVRTVEHYFHKYGGYSTNPLVFLAAASQRTKNARMVAGAVLPVFNHPLKIAGEIGMIDAICGGRLDAGFGRAFIPHEFENFGVSLDESRARFEEGVEQVRQLLEGEDVSCDGQFHSFKNTTSLPRPTQKPRPPFWVAAVTSADSIAAAGAAGHGVMLIPLTFGVMQELIGVYREAWNSAGHPGNGQVMMAYHMFCWPDRDEANEISKPLIEGYLGSLVDAASAWTSGTKSADYQGYDKIVELLKQDTFEENVERGAAWVGTPDDIVEQINSYHEKVGGYESASMQLNFHGLPYQLAEKSARLFASDVMPRIKA